MAKPSRQQSGWAVPIAVAFVGALATILAAQSPWIQRFFVSTAPPPTLSSMQTLPLTPTLCVLTSGDIVLERSNVETKQRVKATIRVEGAGDRPLVYNWHARDGQMNPSGRSNTPESTYTAPDRPVDDVISVTVTAPGCQEVSRTKDISVLTSQTNIGQGTELVYTKSPEIREQEAEALLAETRQWKILFHDSFENNDNKWRGASNDEYADQKMTIVDGSFRFETNGKKSDGALSWAYAPISLVTDFYVGVDLQRVKGEAATDTGAGLLFRKDNLEQFYIFRIFENQVYHVSLIPKAAGGIRLRNARSAVIRPGEVNRLEVIGRGNHFIFFINGKYVDEVDDSQLANGAIDLAVYVPRPEKAVYIFDNLDVRSP